MIFARRLARALAQRLNAIAEPTITLTAVDETIEMRSLEGGYEVADLGRAIRVEPVARNRSTSIHVWFEDAADVTLRLDPIRWDDIEDTR